MHAQTLSVSVTSIKQIYKKGHRFGLCVGFQTVLLWLGDVFLCFTGSESLQREELSNHEHPRENSECAGLSGESTHTHAHSLQCTSGLSK